MQVVTGRIADGSRKTRAAHHVTVRIPLTDDELAKLEATSLLANITVGETLKRIVLVAFFGFRGVFKDPRPSKVSAPKERIVGKAIGRFPCAMCNYNRRHERWKRTEDRRRVVALQDELRQEKEQRRKAEAEAARLRLRLARGERAA